KSSDEEDDDEAGMHDDNDDNDDDEAGMHDDNDDDNNDDNDDDTENQDDDDQEDDGQDYEEQDDVNEQTDSDNDGDDFVHPKLSTHDEKDKEEEDSDPKVHTPSNYASTNDEEIQDAPCTIVQTTQVIEDTHVIITPVNPEAQQQSSSVSSGFVSNMLNPSPDTGIESIFNLNTESTSLIDVPITTIAEPPLLSTRTLPPPPTPLITHLQQTSVPTPTNVPSSSLQDLPNFGSLFGFDHRLKTLETNFSKLNQTNQFAVAVSLILSIVDAFLANKMHEVIKTAVQLQSDRLRDEAQAENADFINKLDDNIKKIIKDQAKEQTSHAVAVNLSELELKKILIDKMESNKKSPPRQLASLLKGPNLIQAEEPRHTTKDLEEPENLELKTGVTEDQPAEDISHLPDWF
ncbi:hypothetical protein Tco_1349877, partial [Tanacetum coccineum]